jgi:hypothetical protein
MRALADLVGVHDAVLVSVTDGKITFQTWSDAPEVPVFGLSAHAERGERRPVDLLERLAPSPEIVDEPPPIELPPPPPKKWYRKRTWQLGIASAVAAAIVGGYLIHQAMPDTWGGFAQNVVLPGGSSTRR